MTSRDLSRRHLLTLGAAASSAALGIVPEDAVAAPAQVPRRVLGKTKQSIPILLVGGGMGFQGSFDARIKLALEHGAGVEEETRDPRVAYAPFAEDVPVDSEKVFPL